MSIKTESSRLAHVEDRWDESVAAGKSGLELLVYRSNILGDDGRITNTGGGNTSSKLIERDPLTGAATEVLWVKGSGGDLRTSTAANFAALEMRKLEGLKPVYAAEPVRGTKTPAEDRMVGLYPHCTYNLNPRAASIDTPLHAFIPRRHVDHTHPNAVISVAASRRARELTKEIYGDEVVWTPWMRPGFELGLELERLWRERPGLKGVVMGQHGLINAADDQRECYALSLELIDRAARFIAERDRGEETFGGAQCQPLAEEERNALLVRLLPWLRGRLAEPQRQIATVQTDGEVLRFVCSRDAARLARLGTSCPDHFLRTRIRPLFVSWNPQRDDFARLQELLQSGLEEYRREYAAYYERCRRPDSPAMRGANPTVILIPGVGMVAWGKNKSESRVTAEFYNCAIEVMRGAEAIDEYIALPEQEAFDIEYWLLEEAKLQRMPPEKRLERRVCLVVGAGSGIGHAVAHRLAADGAHVVCADRDAAAAARTASELTARHGQGIGVAGSGISGCGPAIGLGLDMTSRESVRSAIARTVLAYGGLDHLVVTAGIYVPPQPDGSIADEAWGLTFDVNVMGPFRVIDELRSLFAGQGLTGSVVITTSVNGLVSKKGSLAYDASKAAANHLVRELAVELAPLVRVNAVAPATVVAGSAMFPRERVIASLAKYGLPWKEGEETEVLRDRLARFYAERTLLRQPILPADQAEAIAFLVDDRSGKTTGQILAVDGGLPEAFVR